MSDDVTITVRVNNQTANGFRDINGQLRTLDGRFASSAGNMRRSSDGINRALMDVRASLLSLAPAAVPVAASLAPIAVQAGAAGLAVASFGAAVIPQIANLKSAADAQDKYTQAVTKYGAGSKQATQAQQFIADTLKGMPAPTQRAAAAYSNLRDQFKGFSDSTAKFTMAPVEHSFAVLGAILPKLKPMVEGTSTQLDRLVKVAAGGINSGGFDALSKKVSDFANQSLKSATDKAIHFVRVLSEGNAHGPIASFMEYARAQGPAVKDLITNLAKAVSNLLEGAAQAGPGMLTLVNAFAKLVAAVPPSLIGTLMSVYAAFKLIKLAGAGVGAIAAGWGRLATRVTELRAAAIAAGGGIRGLTTAMGSLSAGAKFSVVAGGVLALVMALHELSDNKAPVEVDKLSTSLNTLVTTGKVTGTLKTNFDEISASIAMMSKGASDNKFLKLTSDMGTWLGIAKGPSISDATKNLDAWDKVMANNVKAGNPKLAAAQFELLKKAWKAGGGDLDRLKKFTDDYSGALEDQKFEAQIAAESMGIFGAAAQETQATLDAQKRSADGLRASIIALNDVNRSAYDAQIGFEASLDSLSESFKKNGATLDLNTEAGRANGTAMSQAAKAQDEMIASGLAAGDSLASMTKKSGELRGEMVRLATEAFDGNKKKAQEYVNTLMGTPSDIKTMVKLEREEAISGLEEVRSAIQKTPGAKSVTVSTLNGAAIKALEAVGLKTKTLPDGRTVVYTANGKALGNIGAVSSALNRLDGKSAHTTVTNTTINEIITNSKTYRSVHDIVGSANGNIFRGRSYVDGGTEDHVAQIAQPTLRMWAEPETGGEAYIPLAQSKRPRSLAILKDVADDFGYRLEKFAKGGKLTKAQRAARAQSQAEQQARHDAMGQLTISRFGHYAGYQRSEFGSALGRPDSISSLVNALNEWRGIIKKATHGATENRLLKQLDSTGKKLLGYEKAHEKLIKSLEKAKDKLNSLKDASAQLASSVKGNLISSANITKGASGEGTVTLSSVRSGLIASRDKVTAFANALKALKSKGFSKSIIQQVAEAGIDGGGLETAGALLQASASEVSSINQMQGQIEKAAGSAGKTTADAVYAKAIKDQTAVVKKLTGQQDKLAKAMDKLTKAMEKAIERAFGKKAAGGIVGAAASGGLRGGLTLVGEYEPELLDLPAGSRVWSGPDTRRKLAAQAPWASMLNTPRRAPGAAAAAPAGRPEPIVIELRSSGSETDEFLLKILRRAIRLRGGNVNVVLTGRP